MGVVQKIKGAILREVPNSVYERLPASIKKNEIEYQRYAAFADRLLQDFEKEKARIVHNKTIMVINEGKYSYSVFNGAYLTNVIGLCFWALYNGCIPSIRINDGSDSSNNWDWYFLQPSATMFADVDISRFRTVPCTVTESPFTPRFQYANDLNGFSFRFWSFMYQKLVVFNGATAQYIANDYAQTFANTKEKKLAILLRGTDYVALKPKHHPIQPSVEEVLEVADQKIAAAGFRSIYIATEEERLFRRCEDHFGKERVHSNSRSYYDTQFYQNNLQLIGEVHFDRDNDNYMKGIEYLSSLSIISRCDSFVGGNSGGTLNALLMSDQLIDPVVINKGFY